MNGSFLLTLIWIIPFVVALASLPVCKDNHRLIKQFSLVGNLINLIMVILLTLKFIDVAESTPAPSSSSSTVFHFAYKIPWLRIMNIEYNIGIDAISMLMLLLTAIVIFCGVLASWEVREQAKEFFILLNVLVAGVYGVFISIDLFPVDNQAFNTFGDAAGIFHVNNICTTSEFSSDGKFFPVFRYARIDNKPVVIRLYSQNII